MSLIKFFIIKSEVLDVANCSENKLVKPDVSNLANQIPSYIIRLLTSIETLLKFTTVDVKKKHQFKKERVAMLAALSTLLAVLQLESVQHKYKNNFLMYNVNSKRVILFHNYFIGSYGDGKDKYRKSSKIVF